MKLRLAILLLATGVAAFAATPKNCGCECCVGKDTCCCVSDDAEPAAQGPRHPLKGIVMDIVPEQHALLVKHEEIPGFMRAMTMMLKVGPAALRDAQKGQAITGQITRRGNSWWLEEVVLATP